MTEKKKIERGLARKGRDAYRTAKNNNQAFILSGNKIICVAADGSREQVRTLSMTRVKAKQKKYTL